jgi:carbamoyl-phosphate synthase large subunit
LRNVPQLLNSSGRQRRRRTADGRKVGAGKIGAQELNILFTCAGRRVVLLREFRRAMQELGVTGKIVATDVTPASAAYHTADAGALVPPAGTIDYVPALKRLCVQHKIGLLIPLTDLDLRSLARHRQEFVQMGCEPMIGSPETIMTCRDKTRTGEFLKRIGLPSIRTLTLAEFRQQPFFPCFVKPVRGSASIGTGVLHSEPELNAHIGTFGDLMLVQDYVPGAEYTLDIFRSRDGKVRCVVPRQRLAIRSGEVEKGLTVNDRELIDAGVLLGEKLGEFWGVINAQCRRPAGGRAHFFEINPRFGGGAPLAIAAGADLPRYVLAERLSLNQPPKLGQFQANLLMVRYDDAVYVGVDDPAALPGYDTPTAR